MGLHYESGREPIIVNFHMHVTCLQIKNVNHMYMTQDCQPSTSSNVEN